MKQDSVSDSVAGTGRVTVRAIAAETGLSIARHRGSSSTSIHKATCKHAITAVMDLSAPDEKPLILRHNNLSSIVPIRPVHAIMVTLQSLACVGLQADCPG